MRRGAPLLCVALLLLTGCNLRPPRGPLVTYLVTIAQPPVQRAEISASITGLDSGQSSLHLAMVERYAFVRLAEPLLGAEIEATGVTGNSLAVIREGPYQWSVLKGDATEIRLAYTVPLIHHSLPEIAGRDEYEQPYIAEDHGLLVTGTLFVAPDRGRPADFRVRFAPPDGWALHCPWPEEEDGLFAPETLGALWDDLVAIGDWRVRETERGGMKLTIAVAPGQERLEQAAAPFIAEIVGSEIDLFGMTPREKYLVLFVTPRETQMAGSPKNGSITMAVPLNENFALAEMSHLVAHEFHHTWLQNVCELPDELRFYNEGFTDYCAYLVCARLGIISEERFVSELAQMMDACTDNRAASRYSLVEAGGDPFFEDPAAERLAYAGGALVAALLDLEIHAAKPGTNLDSFLRSFNNDGGWGWSNPPSLADWLDTLSDYLDAEAIERYRRLVSEPYALEPVSEFARLGVTVRERESDRIPTLRVTMDGNRIERMDGAGPAAKMGLRRGDVILSLNHHGVSGQQDLMQVLGTAGVSELVFEIDRGGVQVTLRAPLPRDRWHEVDAATWWSLIQ